MDWTHTTADNMYQVILQLIKKFIPPENISTQWCLDQICEWTDNKKMKLNSDKSIFMTINFTRNYQFNTRQMLDNNLLEQMHETRLL